MVNAAKLGHALLLLTTVLTLISGVKPAGGQPVVSVESQEAIRGDSVDVPLQLEGFGDIGAISLIIAYDPEVLSFPEGADTDELISEAPRSDFSANVPERGELRISWFDATGSNPISIGNGTLLQLSFDNYAGGTGHIAFGSDSEIGDVEGNPYEANYRDGEVRSAASQIEVSVQRRFESAVDASNYELVALPGRAGVSLSETVVGRQGTAWRAFRELGATAGGESTRLKECTSQSSCIFQAGGGFWLIARGEWSFEGAVPGVLARDGTPSIPLQEGWNIISNPLKEDIAWANVQAANGLQKTLWRWEGESRWAEASTLRSATSGVAYYVFNEVGLDSLDLPVADASMGSSGTAPGSTVSKDTVSYGMASRSVALQAGSSARWDFRAETSHQGPRPPAWHTEDENRLAASERAPAHRSGKHVMELRADIDGEETASVTLGIDSTLEEPKTYRAPPAHFQETTLHVVGDDGSSTYALKILPAANGPRRFPIRLEGPPGRAVRLVAVGSSDWKTRAVLTERRTGETWDLQSTSEVDVSLPEDGRAQFYVRIRTPGSG